MKSTPHKKGEKRKSGKSFHYKIVLPDDLKPLRDGMYKIWVTVNETTKKKTIGLSSIRFVALFSEAGGGCAAAMWLSAL